jgi:hypothetical protein
MFHPRTGPISKSIGRHNSEIMGVKEHLSSDAGFVVSVAARGEMPDASSPAGVPGRQGAQTHAVQSCRLSYGLGRRSARRAQGWHRRPAGLDAFTITRGLPHGHIAAALGTARKIGLDRLLGLDGNRCRDLILALLVGRVLDPGPKLAAATTLSPETTLPLPPRSPAACRCTKRQHFARRSPVPPHVFPVDTKMT